jgi:hypothetical protein
MLNQALRQALEDLTPYVLDFFGQNLLAFVSLRKTSGQTETIVSFNHNHSLTKT